MTEPNDTHGYRLKGSKRHANELITRVPVNYLEWMVNSHHTEAEYAAAELKRRGTVTPTLNISGHAIDRASLKCRDIWHQTRGKEEGLHAWLVRMATVALKEGTPNNEKIAYGGMLWVFEQDGVWPVLKTVMRGKGGKEEQ